MNSATLHGDTRATTATLTPKPPLHDALLRTRTKYYERHVLAWYALGRADEARAAWAAVCELRTA